MLFNIGTAAGTLGYIILETCKAMEYRKKYYLKVKKHVYHVNLNLTY